jgi:prevent-host-death family protein
MAPTLARRIKSAETASVALIGMERWKLEDAKARLSEVVRHAGTAGPQLVTIRGREAAVILAPEEYKRLLPKKKRGQSLADFLKGLDLGGLDLEREVDRGRDIEL